MSRRNTFTDELDRQGRDRLHDETMIARELQAGGMSRSAALRAAAEHVAKRYAFGQHPGRIVATSRVPGDNGGPILTDKDDAP